MHRFRRLFLLLGLPLLLLLSLPACQRPEEPSPPAVLVPKDQMVRLLTQLHLLEARVDASRLSPDSGRALFQAQQRELLRQVGTTNSDFKHSYRYYGVHGKDLEEIYQAVIDSLGQQQRRLGGPAASAAQPWRHR